MTNFHSALGAAFKGLDERVKGEGYDRLSVVSPSLDWKQRLAAIRANYETFARLVDQGIESWERGDPNLIADWGLLFTPIERIIWGELKSSGLIGFWPQLPVGRFYVDFGHPGYRIAIECDGKEFHDPTKDAKRDGELLEMGWHVFRISGSACFSDPQKHDELERIYASGYINPEHLTDAIRFEMRRIDEQRRDNK